MPPMSPFFAVRMATLAAFACGTSCAALAAGTYTQLYSFTGGSDGAEPTSRLVGDDHGNLYGSALAGATKCSASPSTGCGSLFKLDATGSLTTVFAFPGGIQGNRPSTGLTLARGKLFGGASGPPQPPPQLGLMFSVRPDGTGYTVVHNFDGLHGRSLTGQLQPEPNGGFFGVSAFGGFNYSQQKPFGDGILFYLSRSYSYRVIHVFKGGADGAGPTGVVEDASGNIFGATSSGGGCGSRLGCGTIFEYSPAAKIYSILYTFTDGPDGELPLLGSVGPDGTLYGVTGKGSQTPHGTLFSLTPSGGSYHFMTLTPISSHTIGEEPTDPPTLTAQGALVGATSLKIYGYENGQFVTLLDFRKSGLTLDPMGQLTITPSEMIYGASFIGGTAHCTIPVTDGCGNIFTYSLGTESH